MVNSVAVFNTSNVLIGTFTTIQDAVNASSAGYSLFVSAGVFSESVTISAAVSIFGAGAGQTIVTPPAGSGFVINSDLGAANAVLIDGIEFSGSANGSGLEFTNAATLGTLTITNSAFENNFRNGVAVGGNPSAVNLDNFVLTDTSFTANGGNPTLQTSSGDGDLLLFQYYGDATISDVAFTGAVVGTGPAENAIQFRGDAGVLGQVSLTNVTIGGVYEKQPLALFNYDDISGLAAVNVDITADSTGFQISGNFDGVGGDLNFAALDIDVTGAPDPISLQGDAGSQAITGGAENSNLRGYAGNDTLSGGGGVDRAVYAGPAADFAVTVATNGEGFATSFASVTDNNAGNGDEGADVLSGVELITFLSGLSTLDLTLPVQLFDGSNNLVGTFTAIQAAVNVAGDGYTILVDAGTYAEQVTVTNIDDLTIRGVGGVVTIESPASLVQTSTSSSGREVFSIVTVTDSANVVLENLTVDGRGSTTGVAGANPNYVGVFYRNSSGGLENVDVTGVRDPYEPGTTAGGDPVVSGLQRGVGVQADNDAGPLQSFFMHGGSIADFQKNATVFGYADLDISGVTITGGGAQTIIAQNGIQAFSSSGVIAGNAITGIGYAGPAFAYSGAILAYENTGLEITNNTIVGSNDDTAASKVVGVFIFDFGSPNSGGEVSGNSISFVDTGIGIYGDIQPNQIGVFGNSVTNIDLTDPFAAGLDHQPNAGLLTPFDIEGTSGGDSLFGSDGADVFRGLEGADVIDGGAGDDTLRGGLGLDTLTGGAGADTADYSDFAGAVSVNLIDGAALSGGSLNAGGFYIGGADEDALSGVESIIGSSFGDRLITSSASSVVNGGGGGDRISAFSGADLLIGGAGDDTLEGGANADTLQGGLGADVIDGGTAFDTVDYSDRTEGGVNVNVINGVALTGGFVNAAGFYQGGAQEDTILNLENINGTNFADRLIAGSTSARIEGRGGNDYLYTFSGNDTIFGGGGNDFISTAKSTDQLFGENGNDTLNGGTGFDTLNGGADSDTADYSDRDGGVNVNLVNGTGVTGGALNMGGFYVGGFTEDQLVSIENVIGSNFGDRLVGLNAGSRIDGRGGNDNIAAFSGQDTLIGGAGNDTLAGGAGADVFEFASGFGADRITDFDEGASVSDVIRLVGLGAAFDSFAEVIAAASQSGGDVVFNFGGGNTITVAGATIAAFDANDFSFG